METHAQLVGMGPGLPDQLGRLIGGHTELAGQREHGTVIGNREPDDQRDVLGVIGFLDDLAQLRLAIERKDPHAEFIIGAADGLPALDRMQEGHAGLRAPLGDELDLGDRGHVEKARTGPVQRIDDPSAGVRLDGVENLAREIFLEPVARFGNAIRTCADDRAFYVP